MSTIPEDRPETPRQVNVREEKIRRAHVRPDEEPDFDFDPDGTRAWDREEEFASGHCDRCGIAGHRGAKCPTITPDLLKPRAS